MSNEEKKAFQYYKECNEKDLENYEYLHEVSQKQVKYLEILLNLIEKQSKEIEELESQIDNYVCYFGERSIGKTELLRYSEKGYNMCNKLWKEKIKATIENFKIVRDEILINEKEFKRPMMTYDYCVRMLEELLGNR